MLKQGQRSQMGHQRVGDETARWPDHLEVPYAEVLWEGCTDGQDYLCMGSHVWVSWPRMPRSGETGYGWY